MVISRVLNVFVVIVMQYTTTLFVDKWDFDKARLLTINPLVSVPMFSKLAVLVKFFLDSCQGNSIHRHKKTLVVTDQGFHLTTNQERLISLAVQTQ